MNRRLTLLLLTLTALTSVGAQDTFNQIDESGNVTQRSNNQNFNKHSNDSTSGDKEVPKGYYVWTVDRKFGDVIPATPDTLYHLYMNTTFNTGLHQEYNTTGSNFTARQSRIFVNREESSSFIFTQPYSYFITQPDDFLFTNTLSPVTRVNYDNCGDKQFGEDRIDAKFAVNANKRLGIGFQLRYDYARGYFSNQSTSHFDGTLFGSYIGDRYQMHALFSANHQKASENGGITNDEYVTHPESFQDSYTDSEIPTVLSQNWNRNNNQHLFFTHRYSLGFYRDVKMTDEEIKARQFAKESKKGREKPDDKDKNKGRKKEAAPSGRPDGAAIVGDEPKTEAQDLLSDSTRIKVNGQAAIDSLNQTAAASAENDSTMKKEYVPVTSFIHTLDLNNYNRIYQAYATPDDYYMNKYYSQGQRFSNDSIYDQTRHLQVKNTFGIALLEGFNKYMKAGLKGFITHEYRKYEMPDLTEGTDTAYQRSWNENTVSVGGLLSKTQGNTLHFRLQAEAWLVGEDAGQLKLDFNTDLNFRLLGDTVRLAAHAYLHRLHPTFYQRTYHAKHLWWDNDDLSKETRTRIEGIFSYDKTDTRLRVAVEEIQDYTYYGTLEDAKSKTNALTTTWGHHDIYVRYTYSAATNPTGIDIDGEAAAQARENVAASPFADRIGIVCADVRTVGATAPFDAPFDAIVCNPPYFRDSLPSRDTRRTLARHTLTLSFRQLMESARRLLADGGELSVVVPSGGKSLLEGEAALAGLFKVRQCDVRTAPAKAPKRHLMAFRKHPAHIETAELTVGSDDCRKLTEDFYADNY